MLETELFANVVLSSSLPSLRMPGSILGPITAVLGTVYSMLFEFVDSMVNSGSLGFAIILFTLIVKIILFPLMVKQQKSSYKMQMLQPEMEKIKNKYKGKSDQLSQQKMTLEIQDLQKSNGVSLLGGCLPMLIQLPILYALFYLFQNPYVYVDVIGQNYMDLANAILEVPAALRMEVFGDYAQAFVDANSKIAYITANGFDLSRMEDIVLLVSHIPAGDWPSILAQLGDNAANVASFIEVKNSIETFLGLSLVTSPGLGFPGIFIPLAAAASTFAQSKLTMMATPQNNDPNNPAASMTKTMTYMMPIMMGFFCISMPAGLGLYWTISNLFGVIQQLILQKFYKKKFTEEAAVNA